MKGRKGNYRINIKKFVTLIILLILVLFFSILSPRFFTWNNCITILRQASYVGVLSVGMTFILITGGIDLSVGVQMGLCGMISGVMMVNYQMPVVVSIISGVLVSALVGMFNGIAITYTKMPPLIATLGTMNIVYGLNYTITNGLPVMGLPSVVNAFGQGYVGPIPVPVIIMAVIIIIGAFILNKTYLGRYIYAIGSNLEAARLSGIATKKISVLVYALGGFCSGIAGLIMLGRLSSAQPMTGKGTEMDVITACVVGGISTTGGEGNIIGMVIGVLIVAVLTNGMAVLGLGEFYQYMMKGAILIIAVGIDSLQKTKGK